MRRRPAARRLALLNGVVLNAAIAALAVHPIVRTQLVRTSRRATSASKPFDKRSCIGTCTSTVLPNTTVSSTPPTNGNSLPRSPGGSRNNHTVVTPSAAIGGPTTKEVNVRCRSS